MRKLLAAALTAATLALTACSSGGITAEYAESSLSIPTAGITLNIPEDWTVSTGDSVYDGIIADSGGIYADKEELKTSAEEQGVAYIAYAKSPDSSVIMTVSVHDMEAGERTEGYTYLDGAEFAHSVHDGIIFDYQMQGCSTRGTGEFTEGDFGGVSGWLSHFEIYQPTDDGDIFVLGQYELMTERDKKMYMIQLCYAEGCGDAARAVIDSAGRID